MFIIEFSSSLSAASAKADSQIDRQTDTPKDALEWDDVPDLDCLHTRRRPPAAKRRNLVMVISGEQGIEINWICLRDLKGGFENLRDE
jgi:hypothetical protein